MKNKDDRDDIWISNVGGWWLTGYLVGLGIATTIFVFKLLGWLGEYHPALAGFVVLGVLSWILIWLPRKAMNMPFEDRRVNSAIPSPTEASALMPNDADLDTELRFLIIADKEQRRTGDDK